MRIQPTKATLYTAIRQQLTDEEITAVQVLGLEHIANLDRLLAATDPVREEFRNSFSFPLIIWVNNNARGWWCWFPKRRRIAISCCTIK
ncbi:MAG: hypothetical protein SW833_14755 [Cyanobacteriota bacterium]|nr:hypothetical protein [Cyanobacteriota bacterium]